MIEHPRTLLEQLDDAGCETIYQGALRILETAGIVLSSGEATEAVLRSGATEAGGRLRFPPEVIERSLASAPRRFVLHARGAGRDVELGGGGLAVCPGYGSPSVADRAGRRRDATMADFRAFATVAGKSDSIDVTGGLLVEPLDVPQALRPLETTLALVECSDKPFMGSVAGAEGARESIELARIVFPDMERRAVLMGLVNINSPLRIDARMAGALVEYARAGQAVLLTPGILMGVTAPVTAAGALAQATAELMAGVAVVQAVRKGAPVMVGTGGFGSDLRTAGPGFGRPENAVATTLGAQIARRLGLPFRCSGAVTGSRTPDCRSGYERMMTAFAAWASGAHFCLQGAGTLDSINAMCYEQLSIDLEVWGYIKRMALRPATDPPSLALELIGSLPTDYLACEHTVEHMRQELYTPALADPLPYDEWLRAGGPDVVTLAAGARATPGTEPTPLEEGLRRELHRYAARRREALR